MFLRFPAIFSAVATMAEVIEKIFYDIAAIFLTIQTMFFIVAKMAGAFPTLFPET
jgi:hypothetical protein